MAAFKGAARFWERGRIVYNGILIAVVAAWLLLTWPHFRPALTLQSGLLMLVQAALANACYCAAYPVDVILQLTARGGRRPFWRIPLWCLGSLFAAALACYWIADEIYPYVVSAVPVHG